MTTTDRITDAFRKHKPQRIPVRREIERAVKGAQTRISSYVRMGAISPGDRILDVGCAWGVLGLALPPGCTYVGIDASLVSIRMARDIMPEHEFHHVDVRVPKYNPNGSISPKRIEFPVDALGFDSVLACSLFTHFDDLESVARYLHEISTALVIGGRFLSTWFRSPPNKAGGTDRRFAWPEERIHKMLSLFPEWIHDVGGETDGHDDQWHIVVQA